MKKNQKLYLYGGGGLVLLYLLYRWYQNHQASSGANAATSGTAATPADLANQAGQEQADVAALQGEIAGLGSSSTITTPSAPATVDNPLQDAINNAFLDQITSYAAGFTPPPPGGTNTGGVAAAIAPAAPAPIINITNLIPPVPTPPAAAITAHQPTGDGHIGGDAGGSVAPVNHAPKTPSFVALTSALGGMGKPVVQPAPPKPKATPKPPTLTKFTSKLGGR